MHWYSTPAFQDACLQVQANPNDPERCSTICYTASTHLQRVVKVSCIFGLRQHCGSSGKVTNNMDFDLLLYSKPQCSSAPLLQYSGITMHTVRVGRA